MIRDNYNSGGGTGFAVTAPSGQNYILTNDHVCGVSKDGETVLVTGEDVSLRRRIIAHDENSDLCLVEGVPGVKGISVANSGPGVGDTLYVVGHPHLMPRHVSSGEITGKEDVQILMAPISYEDPDTGEEVQISPRQGGWTAAQCSMPKYSVQSVDIDLLFLTLKVKFCVLTVKDAYTTGITIFPGNSGSPMVNFWGNLEGVAFAGDDTNWGRMVPIQDIKAFLKNF
jgi:S1-C subfamily serine protease